MRSVKKPWGRFEELAKNERVTVKLLYVEEGCRLSYQYHRHRREFWWVVKGRVVATVDSVNTVLREGESVEVPVRGRHRVAALVDSVLLEVARGRFDEDDIVRVEDDYGRLAETRSSNPSRRRGHS
jgi:mannose-6-phosphate isomerase-like protein (cupin superfamily)